MAARVRLAPSSLPASIRSEATTAAKWRRRHRSGDVEKRGRRGRLPPGEPVAAEEASTRRRDGADLETQTGGAILFSTSLSSSTATLLLPTRAPLQPHRWSTNGRKGGGRRRGHRVRGSSG
jgi:hypothetical protein